MQVSASSSTEYQAFSDKFRYTNWSDEGPLLHVAHATGLCAGAYTAFSKHFSKEYRVVGLDQRGHGKTKVSADPDRLKNWEVFVQDLKLFFEHFNQPIIAMGHSLGGTVSAMLAARYPELISRLVLIEPGFMPPLWRPFVYFVQKSGLSMRVPYVTGVIRRKHSWQSEAEAVRELSQKGPFKNWKPEPLKDYILHGMERAANGSLNLACSPLWEGRILATAPCGIWKEVSRIKCPTLALYGEKSTTFLPSVAAKVKKLLPHAVVKEMKGAGHFIPMEHPKESADLIMQFLK